MSSDTKYSTDGHPIGWSGGDRAVDQTQEDEPGLLVVENTDTRSDEFVLYESDTGTVETVHDYHRGKYPRDDDVVRVLVEENLEEFLEGLEQDVDVDRLLDVLRALEIESVDNGEVQLKVYAYPESRLGRVDS